MGHWTNYLPKDTCPESRRWCLNFESPEEAWSKCNRGDWMLWILGRHAGGRGSDSERKLVGCAAACAELALPIFEVARPEDYRVRDCINACKRYSQGDGFNLDDAAGAAWAAAWAAWVAAWAAGAAAGAAWAAAGAARAAAGAAWAAAWATGAAAGAARAAAWAARAAGDATGDAARDAALLKCAKIVREAYPEPPELT